MSPLLEGLTYDYPWTRPVKRQNGRVTGVSYADRIRELALSWPSTYEDSPWGFPVFKVGANRMFAWLHEGDPPELTVKLTREERAITELLPFVRKASHVGRYGWVTATVKDDESLEAALEWLRESYWLRAPAELKSAVE